ncbi:hypothetical protein NUW54_g9155 [Trametes sanguinea]|uniref:Uncharacterized protein n=1 Tax=Trametes sanguinea TaxID=158606 RepID=A0ACC1P8L4_9APHY|nr:hypothetical protein NUW54_g9155 [Trametes sanguinea]
MHTGSPTIVRGPPVVRSRHDDAERSASVHPAAALRASLPYCTPPRSWMTSTKKHATVQRTFCKKSRAKRCEEGVGLVEDREVGWEDGRSVTDPILLACRLWAPSLGLAPPPSLLCNSITEASVSFKYNKMQQVTGTDDGSVNPGATEYEMSIRLERLRVQEALTARDVAVGRLAEACASVREKTSTIQLLKEEKNTLQGRLDLAVHSAQALSEGMSAAAGVSDGIGAGVTIRTLTECIQKLENKLASLSTSENASMANKEGDENDYRSPHEEPKPSSALLRRITRCYQPVDSVAVCISNPTYKGLRYTRFSMDTTGWRALGTSVALPTANTAEKIESRYSVLANLPLPSGIPDDALTPIVIPAPHTLHDFISTTSGRLRSQIGNYRVFQESTTTWCPEREEHGYYLTPVFKCNTNPRVTTAHRWSAVDLSAKLDKPTECFFNKDGKWYYAGVYKSFRLEDLCTQEWECLSTETSQALVKETLAGRKNTSPQNGYETGQLYAAGALKVACIGLQCIGFNDALYRGLLEHAAHCTLTGKWRATTHNQPYVSGVATGLGLGSPAQGVAWNINVNAMPVPSPVTFSSPIVGYSSPAAEYCSPGFTTAPGSPAMPLSPPGQHLGRVPGLVSVPPGPRNLQHSG